MVLRKQTFVWLLALAVSLVLAAMPLLPPEQAVERNRTRGRAVPAASPLAYVTSGATLAPAAAAAATPAAPSADAAAAISDVLADADQMAAAVADARRRLQAVYAQLVMVSVQDAQEKALYERAAAAGLSPDVTAAMVATARDHGVPLAVLIGVITVESNWRPNLVHRNWDGSRDYGLMQINERTLPHLAAVTGTPPDAVLDPLRNVTMGIYHLGYLKEKYGDWHHALTAYNRGEYGLQLYVQDRGTGKSEYSQRVLALAAPDSPQS